MDFNQHTIMLGSKMLKHHFLVTKQLIWLLINSCFVYSNMYSLHAVPQTLCLQYGMLSLLKRFFIFIFSSIVIASLTCFASFSTILFNTFSTSLELIVQHYAKARVKYERHCGNMFMTSAQGRQWLTLSITQ